MSIESASGQNNEVIPLTARVVVKRPRHESYQPGKGNRLPSLLSPHIHPGTREKEGFLDRLISHRLLLDLPDGSDASLINGRAEGTAYVYRVSGNGNASLLSGVWGSSLSDCPAYAYPTTDAVKHPLRTVREFLGKGRKDRFVLVDFKEQNPNPPANIIFERK